MFTYCNLLDSKQGPLKSNIGSESYDYSYYSQYEYWYKEAVTQITEATSSETLKSNEGQIHKKAEHMVKKLDKSSLSITRKKEIKTKLIQVSTAIYCSCYWLLELEFGLVVCSKTA
jgi:hypothetical protein